MQKTSKNNKKTTTVVAVAVLALVAVAVPLYSYSQSLNVSNASASSTPIIVTNRFSDNFADGVIDTKEWTVIDSTDAVVRETSGDNLTVKLPKDKVGGAGLKFNEPIDALSDFSMDVYAYRPVINGAGAGGHTVRFSSKGSTDKETAVLAWTIEGGKSTLRFSVTGKDGKKRFTAEQPTSAKEGVLRLVRVDTDYRAYFKPTLEVPSDVSWVFVGQCLKTNKCSSGLGGSGTLQYLAVNNLYAKMLPQIQTRVDSISIGWQVGDTKPAPITTTSFRDSFSNGTLDKEWTKVVSPATVKVTETTTDNLRISLPGDTNGKVQSIARLTRKTPVIGIDKNFNYTATIYRPTVTGAFGLGSVGIAFVSSDKNDKESARITWESDVKKNGALKFVVMGQDGKEIQSGTENVSQAAKLTVQLRRQVDDAGNRYTAWYRFGDTDTKWIQIGKTAVSEKLGADGKLSIVAKNIAGAKPRNTTPDAPPSYVYPEVVLRIDSVSAVIEK